MRRGRNTIITIMPRTFSVLSSLLCLGFVFAQDACTTSSLAVPTGTPVGDYSGALRPQVHFSPPKGFMVRIQDCPWNGRDTN
jgi:hypothetical protein